MLIYTERYYVMLGTKLKILACNVISFKNIINNMICDIKEDHFIRSINNVQVNVAEIKNL